MRWHFGIILSALIGMALLVGTTFYYILPNTEDAILIKKLRVSRDLTQLGWSVLSSYAQKEKAGLLTREKAQDQALKQIEALRYGLDFKNYFWVQDMRPRMLMHPYRPDLVGKDISTLKGANGKLFIAELLEKVRQQGESSVSYHWQYKDDSQRIVPKISFGKLFEPWNWIVATGVYADDIKIDMTKMRVDLIRSFSAVILIITLLSGYTIFRQIKAERGRAQVAKALVKSEHKKELARYQEKLEKLVEKRTQHAHQNHEVLKKSQERYLAMLESSPDPVVVYDNIGQVTYMNPAFEKTYGWTKQDLEGKKIDFVPPHEAERTRDAVQRTLAGEDVILETQRLTKDGRLLDVLLRAACHCDKDGHKEGMVVVSRDISKQKAAERALKLARQEAEKANRAKSDFLARMSHEIRTPMNAIIGLSHLTLQTELTPKQDDYITKIQSSSQALLGIINDILDFSKVEAGKLNLEMIEFNLEKVIDDVCKLTVMRAQEKGLELLVNKAPAVPTALLGDPLRLSQVLINLLNNAIKFTEKGEVVLSVEQKNKIGTRIELRFAVRDTGIGLTPQQKDNIFQAFAQADTSTTRQFGGTGLGLAICQRLVEMMEGHIRVESQPGQGAEFIFTVVFGLAPSQKVKPLVLQQELQSLKILVVDDNNTSREILHEMLASMGVQVSLAASGEEAIAELEAADKTQPFDLVFMDWHMQGMDGIETSRKIKKHPQLINIPHIILVTAYGREDIIAKAKELDLGGFLLKPVNPSLLLDSIHQALGGKALSDKSELISEEIRFNGEPILVVEDNLINQQVAQEILIGLGLTVEVAQNGREAVDMIKTGRHRLVLMDIQMPVLDGYAATRKIRKDPLHKRLPIIAMTANAMTGDREKALAAGMNDHVAKPIDIDELSATLQRWLAKPHDDPAGPDADMEDAVNIDCNKDEHLLEGIDMEEGLGRVLGNQELYLELLNLFNDQSLDAITEIKTALSEKDHQAAKQIAHTLKGVAGNINATDVHHTATQLDTALGQGQLEGIDEIVKKLTRAVETVRRSIASLNTDKLGIAAYSEPGQSNGFVDKAQVKTMIQKMATLIADSDSESKEVADALTSHLHGDEAAMLADMKKKLAVYNFESAQKELQQLAASLDINLKEHENEHQW